MSLNPTTLITNYLGEWNPVEALSNVNLNPMNWLTPAPDTTTPTPWTIWEPMNLVYGSVLGGLGYAVNVGRKVRDNSKLRKEVSALFLAEGQLGAEKFAAIQNSREAMKAAKYILATPELRMTFLQFDLNQMKKFGDPKKEAGIKAFRALNSQGQLKWLTALTRELNTSNTSNSGASVSSSSSSSASSSSSSSASSSSSSSSSSTTSLTSGSTTSTTSTTTTTNTGRTWGQALNPLTYIYNGNGNNNGGGRNGSSNTNPIIPPIDNRERVNKKLESLLKR